MARHGMSKTRTYRSWEAMKYRCNSPKHPKYENYGGRGISYCKEWEDFMNFYEDLGDRPEGTSLDRIDNDWDYCKENCRWATIEEQNRNRRAERVSKNNISGVTGVSYQKAKGTWQAHYRCKCVGRSKDFKTACKMRKQAEEESYEYQDLPV